MRKDLKNNIMSGAWYLMCTKCNKCCKLSKKARNLKRSNLGTQSVGKVLKIGEWYNIVINRPIRTTTFRKWWKRDEIGRDFFFFLKIGTFDVQWY